jgi:hypothetical protein
VLKELEERKAPEESVEAVGLSLIEPSTIWFLFGPRKFCISNRDVGRHGRYFDNRGSAPGLRFCQLVGGQFSKPGRVLSKLGAQSTDNLSQLLPLARRDRLADQVLNPILKAASRHKGFPQECY